MIRLSISDMHSTQTHIYKCTHSHTHAPSRDGRNSITQTSFICTFILPPHNGTYCPTTSLHNPFCPPSGSLCPVTFRAAQGQMTRPISCEQTSTVIYSASQGPLLFTPVVGPSLGHFLCSPLLYSTVCFTSVYEFTLLSVCIILAAGE